MLDVILANRALLYAATAALALIALITMIIVTIHGGVVHLGAMGTHHYD